MAVTLDTLSPAALAEAEALGLKSPFRDLPSAAGFEAWFAVVEENFRAICASECRAIYHRYQGLESGDLDRFRECYLAYCYDEMIERHCRAYFDDLKGILARRVELFLTHQLQFKVSGHPDVAEPQGALESRFMALRGMVSGEERTYSQLQQLIKSSPRREEREAAWKATVPFGREVREQLLGLVAARNRLARSLGYRDYLDLRWQLSEVDEGWFLGLLDDLEAETRSSYQQACAEISRFLGVERLEPWDLSFGVEAMSPVSPDLFDQSGAMAALKKLLTGWGFDMDQVDIPVGISDAFAVGGICFGIEPGKEVGILLNPGNGPRFYRTFFHEFGHAMHFRYAGQDNMLLNTEDSSFNEGMAVFYESFVSDPAWVRANLDLTEEQREQFCRQARYAALAWLRATLLINIRLEHALYTQADLDPEQYYRQLQSRMAGFELPEEYASRWACDQMLVSFPVYWHSYVIAAVIAHQTRETIENRDGEILDNARVKDFLFENYYLPGASLPWLEKMRRATGDELNAKAYVDYLKA